MHRVLLPTSIFFLIFLPTYFSLEKIKRRLPLLSDVTHEGSNGQQAERYSLRGNSSLSPVSAPWLLTTVHSLYSRLLTRVRPSLSYAWLLVWRKEALTAIMIIIITDSSKGRLTWRDVAQRSLSHYYLLVVWDLFSCLPLFRLDCPEEVRCGEKFGRPILRPGRHLLSVAQVTRRRRTVGRKESEGKQTTTIFSGKRKVKPVLWSDAKRCGCKIPFSELPSSGWEKRVGRESKADGMPMRLCGFQKPRLPVAFGEQVTLCGVWATFFSLVKYASHRKPIISFSVFCVRFGLRRSFLQVLSFSQWFCYPVPEGARNKKNEKNKQRATTVAYRTQRLCPKKKIE